MFTLEMQPQSCWMSPIFFQPVPVVRPQKRTDFATQVKGSKLWRANCFNIVT